MAATAAASAALPPTGPVSGDLEDGNISSPLSEVDDKDANDEEMERMHLDDDDGDNSSFSGEDQQAAHNDGSDSESALSDAASDVNSEANDTEAETLRLYDTPQNPRHRDVVVDQFNQDQVFEHTPSKLRRTTQVAMDDESASGDEASFASSRAGGNESPTKPPAAHGAGSQDDTSVDQQERKRKRSSAAEPSDPDEQPSRKRANSAVNRDVVASEGAAPIEDDATSANPHSGRQSLGEDEDSLPKQDTTPEEEVTEPEPRAPKKAARATSKRKSVANDSADDETAPEAQEKSPDATVEETGENHDEMEIDAEDEAAARNAEETEKKHAAYRDWTQIEDMFGVFRDRLYKDRLQRLEEEEQSLHAPEPTHPEYLNMKQCLDDRLAEKLKAIDTEYEYRIKAHDRRAVAQRAQIWSQFFQAVRERREQALEALNKQWYDVQSARRSAHSLPDYGLLFPKDASQRVRNAIAYNTEVSTLAGLAKYEGFPAGPELKGASGAELEADLALMERARRGRQRPPINHLRDEYQPPHLTRLGPAGEQFLKDTPWANPNHSAHKLYQQPSLQTETSHESSASTNRTVPQNLPSAAELKATYDGSASTQRSPAVTARLSESPEMTRNMIHPSSSHQIKQRMGSLPSLGRGPKAAAA